MFAQQELLRNLSSAYTVITNNSSNFGEQLRSATTWGSLTPGPSTPWYMLDFSEEDLEDIRSIILGKPFQAFERWLLLIAYSIVTLFGVLGNALVCFVVLQKRSMKSPRNIFIMNLALADLALAAVAVPCLLIPKLQWHWSYSEVACKLFNVLPGANSFCSALTIVVCAGDRYFAATSRRIRKKSSSTAAWIVVLLIWTLSFALSLPYFSFCNVKHWPLHPKRQDLSLHATCSCEPPAPFQLTIIAVVKFMFLLPIPLGTLAIFNTLLAKFLSDTEELRLSRRTNSFNQTSANSSHRSSRVMLLLCAMVVSYAALWLPFEVWNLIADSVIRYREDLVTQYDAFRKIDAAFNLLAVTSTCINPLLYGYLNANFNREFKLVYRRLCNAVCCASATMEDSRTGLNQEWTSRRHGDNEFKSFLHSGAVRLGAPPRSADSNLLGP